MAKSKWKLDDNHKSVEFVVKHMMISKVKGTFKEFQATIDADPEDLTTADIEFVIDLNSIDTGNNDRDNHLRSGDFFDVENHPKMTFKSKKVVNKGEGEYDVVGDLTIRGTTREETFKTTYEGKGVDPYGNEVVAFSVEGKVNRKDYGLVWNVALETGGVLVGEDVKFTIETEALKAE
ncbi:polyisoprenoid-binding protein YceI [Salirhabdus euzebyi]|uniref:Polyisoprenoid-binding protein YceI n=1 Tax=Salirhabdus euzebyi TaxID=394506 RepID=A0A841Q6P9_9BACI|nr:YceI family protein [Salirhabdus euzebyi]MBB6454078.1 polyisoprenoid-binding protein YceI [Salirhabdus euzebyi]